MTQPDGAPGVPQPPPPLPEFTSEQIPSTVVEAASPLPEEPPTPEVVAPEGIAPNPESAALHPLGEAPPILTPTQSASEQEPAAVAGSGEVHEPARLIEEPDADETLNEPIWTAGQAMGASSESSIGDGDFAHEIEKMLGG